MKPPRVVKGWIVKSASGYPFKETLAPLRWLAIGNYWGGPSAYHSDRRKGKVKAVRCSVILEGT